MKVKTKGKIKNMFFPLYSLYRRIVNYYYLHNAKKVLDKRFFSMFHRHINWDNPVDLNEKINWQKLHEDMHEWAKLADKYAVREYVSQKGLSDILVPLYGKYDTVQELFEDWEHFPDEFVIKSNNGCGHVEIISQENGGKKAVNKQELAKELRLWLAEKDYGIHKGEFHYLYIKNCIIVEQLMKDETIKEFSSSPIDYKFYCCDGKPYICYVSYGRTLSATGEHLRMGNVYDLKWNERPELMAEHEERRKLDRPYNWENMVEIAEILSSGMPQARIDLYNIEGKIYFGEITMTNAGGFDTEFTEELYVSMGNNITLDLSKAENEFA